MRIWLPEGASPRASAERVSANNLGHGLHDTVAGVVSQTDQVTVLDIGVLTYQQTFSQRLPLPQEPRLAVQLGLRVDPFFYFYFEG